MKTTAACIIVSVVVSVAFGQNGNNMNTNMLNMNSNWGLNNNMNWNGMNMNNWNGMNSNWNNMNSNMNNWNGNGNGMNMNWNVLNTNMRNINGGRGDYAVVKYGDARVASAQRLLMGVAPHPVTVVPRGDGGSAHAVLTSSNDNVMIIAASADDPTEGHAVIAGGDGIGMIHKADV